MSGAMESINRRRFLSALPLSGLAVSTGSRLAAAEAESVTWTLARFAVKTRLQDTPAPVRKEATRTLLNWVGCAIGGSREPAVDKALLALTPFGGSGSASIFGRRETTDALTASLINGLSSHVLDFDDTHLRTIIHPAGPVAP